MSVLFPKVNKPREWDYRPIYYDEEKEARKQKLARLQAERAAKAARETVANEADNKSESKEYVPTLHRGSFREARDAAANGHTRPTQKVSRLSFWIALLLGLIMIIWFLS